MSNVKMSEEEQAYLQSYDISQYERPSVAADMAVFSIMETGEINEEKRTKRKDNYRKDPEKKLKLLLIRRASFPYKDCWALPGGFCKPGESVLATAKRELYEETSVKDAYLQPFDIFSDVDRDPRGWIISHGFLALMNGENYKVHGGSDAWEARWFSVSIEKQELCKKVSENNAHIENLYTMKLICEEQDSLALEAIIKEYKIFENYHENIRYEIVKADGFAFDHAKIILCAYLNLQKEAADIGKIVFDLMPENFTLTELQKAYEIVNGKPLLVANFRRKIADYVVETKDMVMGAGHRPAKLFKRNVEAFYR